MWAMLAATVVNILLDYIFIFIFEWGLFGAAIATDLGELVGTLLLLGYLLRSSVSIRFAKLKMSIKSIRLTLRNTWYMLKLGVSSCLSEITIAVMAIAGNYVFMSHLGTDGVAAYSIVCYLFPIISWCLTLWFSRHSPLSATITVAGSCCGPIRRCVYALFLRLCLLC